jgi:hypothetical protein
MRSAAGNTTVNYAGNYAGAATTTGWGEASQYQSADGEWRFNGTRQPLPISAPASLPAPDPADTGKSSKTADLMQIDVGVNPVTPSTSLRDGNPSTAPATDTDIRAFHTATVELNGTITGSQISGTSDINNSGTPGDLTNNRFVNGERALQAGAFGNNAEQVTGVFATYGVLPSPTGG